MVDRTLAAAKQSFSHASDANNSCINQRADAVAFRGLRTVHRDLSRTGKVVRSVPGKPLICWHGMLHLVPWSQYPDQPGGLLFESSMSQTRVRAHHCRKFIADHSLRPNFPGFCPLPNRLCALHRDVAYARILPADLDVTRRRNIVISHPGPAGRNPGIGLQSAKVVYECKHFLRRRFDSGSVISQRNELLDDLIQLHKLRVCRP
jgi:hypothetical protein